MKKLIFLFAFIAISVSISAQDMVVRTSKVYVDKGAAKDTVNKDSALSLSVLVVDYSVGVKYQVEQTKIKGNHAKTKTYLESSLDNVYWTKVDSVSILGNGKGVSTYKAPYSQYVRLRSVGIDSVQTTKIKYTFLIVKN